jgi:hypothetical protein
VFKGTGLLTLAPTDESRACDPPHIAGRLSCALPTELILVIWSTMALTDLLMYGFTSRFNFAVIQAYLCRKRLSLFRPFFTDPLAFIRVLRRTKSIVSGSVALAFMVPATSLGWSPSDMDIYVTESTVGTWIGYLNLCGYKLERPRKDRSSTYTVRPEIHEVVCLEHHVSGRRIDMIIAVNDLRTPIFRYHSTIVMNCLSADGFFSAYPLLTASLRGVMNPSAMITLNIPPSHVAQCYRKYDQRGFFIAERPSVWVGDEHRCGRSWYCPETLRHTADRGCLFMKFREEPYSVLDPREDQGMARFESEFAVQWLLGGYACDGRREVLLPQLTIVPLL